MTGGALKQKFLMVGGVQGVENILFHVVGSIVRFSSVIFLSLKWQNFSINS